MTASDPQAASERDVDDEARDAPECDPMVAVYRHDIHKVRGRPHAAAAERVAGVRVNEVVPLGADRDAALLSRPRGDPEDTLPAHTSPYRVSLLTGNDQAPAGDDTDAWRRLVTIEDSECLHRAWLAADAPARYHESHHYPYTSLKYHVLLAAALLDNYRAGAAFDELALAVDPPSDDSVMPHRTVLRTAGFALQVTDDPGGQPAAALGAAPARSWADVWGRLPAHPFDVDGARRGMLLDAQLRRVRAWSAGLQLIEDFAARYGLPDGTRTSGVGDAG